jgi:hypothetical protein
MDTSYDTATSSGVTWIRRDEGGYLVHVPAGVISSGDLKQALDSVVPDQYHVQVLSCTHS